MNNSNISFYKKYFKFLLITIFFFYLLLNYTLQNYVNSHTTKDFYVEEIRSKLKHLELQNHPQKDFIFIGNSRTLFHISTKQFEDNNLSVYNLGISSIDITQYFKLSNALLHQKQKSKNIVISLRVNSLFNNKKFFPSYGHRLDDLILSIKSMNLKHIYYTTKSCIENIRLSYWGQLQIKKYVQEWYFNKKTISFHDIFKKHKINLDCKPFAYSDSLASAVLCTNGDGVILKQNNNIYTTSKITELINYNDSYIEGVNLLITNIQNAGIHPIIVFEPILYANYEYDLYEIKSRLHNHHIIDLTGMQFDINQWADRLHLNKDGREIYSTKLIKELNSGSIINRTYN